MKGLLAAAVADRVLPRITLEPSGCWSYPNRNGTGYGEVKIKGKSYRVHRLVWEHFRDVIPEGLEIDHLCRNRACCNPDHLEPVTRGENIRRGDAWKHKSVWCGGWQKARTHCPAGHTYDDANTRVYRGKRNCRICQRDAVRRYRAKAKQ